MQIVCPFHTQIHELGMVDLKTHLQRKTPCVGHQQFVRVPHSVIVEIRIATVRRADDARHTRGLRSLQHAQAFLEIRRSVVNTGKYVAMNVSHTRY